MERYKNAAGNSGVDSYEIAAEWIIIRFVDGGIYLYSRAKPGKVHVEAMKKLAVAGRGLATYINQHVRNNFAEKLV